MSDEKTCANPACGKTFTRSDHSHRSDTDFAARTYCSLDCSIEMNRPELKGKVPPKTCSLPTCGKTYEKKPRESRAAFARRTYCSLSCSAATNKGRRRVLPRKPAPEPIRKPEGPWRPAGWTPKPNVYGPPRQGC